VRQVGGIWAGERDLAAIGGVGEGEADRVQPLAGQAKPGGQHRVGPVEQVTHARVPDRGHVHPDLMGAAGFQVDRYQAGGAEGLERVVMGHAGPPVADHGEPAVARGVPADRRVHGAAQRVGMSLDQRMIALVHRALPEGALQRAVGPLALGHHHHARGVRVQAVHDALAFGRAAGGHGVPGRLEAADDGRAGPAGRRMGGHAARFVHHHDVVVLVEHLEAFDRAGRLRRPWRGQRDLELITGQDAVRLGGRPPAKQHEAIRDELRGLGPGQAEHPRQGGVEPLSVQAVRDGELAHGCRRFVCRAGRAGRSGCRRRRCRSRRR
jgi:hypothetical protein